MSCVLDYACLAGTKHPGGTESTKTLICLKLWGKKSAVKRLFLKVHIVPYENEGSVKKRGKMEKFSTFSVTN